MTTLADLRIEALDEASLLVKVAEHRLGEAGARMMRQILDGAAQLGTLDAAIASNWSLLESSTPPNLEARLTKAS